LIAGRLPRLGAARNFHHGLLGAIVAGTRKGRVSIVLARIPELGVEAAAPRTVSCAAMATSRAAA
jgi:hypothetical protein